MKSDYRLAVVKEVFKDCSGLVRKARIMYKNYKADKSVLCFKGSVEQCVLRPVQRLALILPVEEQ